MNFDLVLPVRKMPLGRPYMEFLAAARINYATASSRKIESYERDANGQNVPKKRGTFPIPSSQNAALSSLTDSLRTADLLL